jgi:hypothetical protein
MTVAASVSVGSSLVAVLRAQGTTTASSIIRAICSIVLWEVWGPGSGAVPGPVRTTATRDWGQGASSAMRSCPLLDIGGAYDHVHRCLGDFPRPGFHLDARSSAFISTPYASRLFHP